MLTFTLWGPEKLPHWVFTERFLRLFWVGLVWGFFKFHFLNFSTYFCWVSATVPCLRVSNCSQTFCTACSCVWGTGVFLTSCFIFMWFPFWKVNVASPLDLVYCLLLLFKYNLYIKKKKGGGWRQTSHEPIFIKDEMWGNTSFTSFPWKVTEQIILEIMSSHLMDKKVIGNS